MIERGYCGHVCNEHLFEASSSVLFYRWFPEAFARLSESAKLKQHLMELNLTVSHLSQGMQHTREQVFENEARLAILEDGVRGISNPLLVLSLLFFLFFFEQHVLTLVPTYVFPGFSAALSLYPYASFLLLLHVTFYSYSLKHSRLGYGVTTRELFRDGVRRTMVQAHNHEGEHDQVASETTAGSSVQVAPLSSSTTARQRCVSEIPRLETWAHRPIMVCTNTGGGSTSFGLGELPLGHPFSFESELFKGICLIRLQNIPSEEGHQKNTADYFHSRRRKFQVVTQGRFKEQMNVGDVLTGHEFSRPLKNLPASWMIRATEAIIKRLAPSTKIEISSRNGARALSLLGATAQNLSIDQPGNEPNIYSQFSISEHCEVFGGPFQSGRVTARERKRILSKRGGDFTFDTESVHTFDFFQHILIPDEYCLNLSVSKIDLTKILDGQPVQLMAKERGGEGRSLWNFQLWHEKLLLRTHET